MQELGASLQSLLGRPGGLTSDQVAARAVATSYGVRAKEQDVLISGAEVDKARLGYVPELKLVARYTRLSSITPGTLGPSDSTMVVSPAGQQGFLPPNPPLAGVPFSTLSFPVLRNQYYAAAGIVVPLSDYFLRVNHACEAARQSTEASRLIARAEALATAANARLEYYNWVRANLQQRVVELSLSQARDHHRSAEAALYVGRLSRADVMQAEAQVASSELLVAQAQRQTAIMEDRLHTEMHDQATGRYEIGEDVLTTPENEALPAVVDELYAESLRNRLELRAVERSLARLEQTRRATINGAFPKLGAFANAYYANPNPRVFPQQERWTATWDAGIELSWLPVGVLSSRADTHSIDAQQAKLQAERGTVRDSLRAEVVDAYQSLREAIANVQSADRGLAAAGEAYRVRRLWFERGRATSVELTDAEMALLQARLGMINARIDKLGARIRLEHAVGRDAVN